VRDVFEWFICVRVCVCCDIYVYICMYVSIYLYVYTTYMYLHLQILEALSHTSEFSSEEISFLQRCTNATGLLSLYRCVWLF